MARDDHFRRLCATLRLVTIRHLGRLGAALFLAACVALTGAPAAHAQLEGFERIAAYDVAVEVARSGRLHVVETIDYEFTSPRHGILRKIPDRFRHDATYDRHYPISNVRVTGSPGTPLRTKLERDGGYRVIRVGDPDRTITGRHRYVITYDVDGALNRFEGHDELYWNVIGSEWLVPIERATSRITAEAAFTASNCFAGPVGSALPCGTKRLSGTDATFSHPRLFPGQAMTVVLALPPGYAAKAGPVLVERQTVRRAFTWTGAPLAAAVAALLGGLAGLVALLRRGRDLRYAGQVPGLEPAAGVDAVTEPVGPFADRAGPIEWMPPKEMSPAMMGVLLDERADILDVTATIVDLAVRGYLRIDELPRKGLFRRRDWRLTRLGSPEGDVLSAPEGEVLRAVFYGQSAIEVSELKNKFYVHLSGIRDRLYDEAVSRGWFPTRPDKVTQRWSVASFVAVLAGGGLTFLLATRTRYGLTGVAVLLVALVFRLLHRRMPYRTAKGSAALARVLGFRRYLATAEADQLRAEEKQHVFARYLPYAIVLGETEHWAKVFDDLGLPKDETMGWYGGPSGWHAGDFTDSIHDFSSAASSTLASTPSSSGSSGFGGGGSSGGGGGGGGGGSW